MVIPKRPLETRYRGVTSSLGSRILREDPSGWVLLVNESDSEWGVDSERTRRVASLLLADAFGDEEAFTFATDFKYDVMINLEDEWVMTVAEIACWLGGYIDE